MSTISAPNNSLLFHKPILTQNFGRTLSKAVIMFG